MSYREIDIFTKVEELTKRVETLESLLAGSKESSLEAKEENNKITIKWSSPNSHSIYPREWTVRNFEYGLKNCPTCGAKRKDNFLDSLLGMTSAYDAKYTFGEAVVVNKNENFPEIETVFWRVCKSCRHEYIVLTKEAG